MGGAGRVQGGVGDKWVKSAMRFAVEGEEGGREEEGRVGTDGRDLIVVLCLLEPGFRGAKNVKVLHEKICIALARLSTSDRMLTIAKTKRT